MDIQNNQWPAPEDSPGEMPAPPAAPQQRPVQPPAPPRFSYPKPKRSKAPLIILIIVIVLAVGGAVYWFTAGPGHKSKSSTSGNSSASGQTSGNTQDESTTSSNSGTKTYKSNKLGLEVTYRSDWTKKENSDKSEIILTSPSVSYADKDGNATQGMFTLKIRNGLLPDAMKTTIQNAVAVKDSEVIAYAKPTDQQRQYTNLSFGGNATNMKFFMVSGSIAFKTGEAFGSSIDTQGSVFLAAGGFGADAQDALNFDLVPQAAFTSSTVYKQAVSIVESLRVF